MRKLPRCEVKQLQPHYRNPVAVFLIIVFIFQTFRISHFLDDWESTPTCDFNIDVIDCIDRIATWVLVDFEFDVLVPVVQVCAAGKSGRNNHDRLSFKWLWLHNNFRIDTHTHTHTNSIHSYFSVLCVMSQRLLRMWATSDLYKQFRLESVRICS